MKRILITGKSGYIATSFVNYIKEKYNKVFCVDAISVRDDSFMDKDFSQYDAVLHLAGLAHVDINKLNEEEKQKYFEVNTDLTEKVARKAKKDGVKYFYYSSSVIVYGEKSFDKNSDIKLVTKETMPYPDNFYGESKLKACEKIKQVYNDGNYGIFRFPMVYGKNNKGNFNALIKFAKKLPAFPIYEKQEKSAIYIENLCEFMKIVIEKEMTGVFYPQNSEFFNTYRVVKILNDELVKRREAKKIVFIPFMEKFIDIVKNKVKLANKAFGNLIYDKELSDIGVNYNVVGWEEGIRKSV